MAYTGLGFEHTGLRLDIKGYVWTTYVRTYVYRVVFGPYRAVFGPYRAVFGLRIQASVWTIQGCVWIIQGYV